MKAVEIREKVLEPDHPSLATSYNNLSLIYQALGDFPKALEYQLKDVEISEKVLEQDHPSLAISYCNLASIYLNLNNIDKAWFYIIKAEKIVSKKLEPGHPSREAIEEWYNHIKALYEESETERKK